MTIKQFISVVVTVVGVVVLAVAELPPLCWISKLICEFVNFFQTIMRKRTMKQKPVNFIPKQDLKILINRKVVTNKQ